MPTETQRACVNATQALLEMDLFVGKMKYAFIFKKKHWLFIYILFQDQDGYPDEDLGCSDNRCKKDNCPQKPNSGTMRKVFL